MTDFFADLEAQLRAAHGRRPSRVRRAARPALVAASLALVAGAAVALAVALGGGSRGEPAAHHGPPAPRLPVPTTSVPPPAHGDAIGILNGTTIPGLGARIAKRLIGSGFTLAAVTDANRQDAARTRVLYRPGKERAAFAAAARLRVRMIEPLVAGNADERVAPAGADVVVVVGTDARNGLVGAPEPTASFELRPSGANGPATGTVVVRRRAGLQALVEIRGLPARRRSYAVWLTGNGRAPRALGFTPQVQGDGRLRFSATLPGDAARYSTLRLTREAEQRPVTPGPTVVQGTIVTP